MPLSKKAYSKNMLAAYCKELRLNVAKTTINGTGNQENVAEF